MTSSELQRFVVNRHYASPLRFDLRLVVCSLDLDTDLIDRPAVQPFRDGLMTYLADVSVRPHGQLDPSQLRALLTPSPVPDGN